MVVMAGSKLGYMAWKLAGESSDKEPGAMAGWSPDDPVDRGGGGYNHATHTCTHSGGMVTNTPPPPHPTGHQIRTEYTKCYTYRVALISGNVDRS